MVVVGDPAAVRGHLEAMEFGPLTGLRRRGSSAPSRWATPSSARAAIYTGRIINLDIDQVRFPDGSTGELDIIRHPGASAVVPFLSDPTGEDPQILLIKQYRYAAEDYLYEIPAGRLDPDESPADCARRELQEETGCTAERLSSRFTRSTRPRASPTSGFTSSWPPDSTQGESSREAGRVHDGRDDDPVARAGVDPDGRDPRREDGAGHPLRRRDSPDGERAR